MKYFSIILTVISLGIVAAALFVLGSWLPLEANYEFRIVESGSMEPAVRTGSVVAYMPRDHYEVGDIIVFAGTEVNPMPTMHRIIMIEDGRITTKGDANEEADYRLISEEEILGAVFLSVPHLGYMAAYFGTPNGKAVLATVGIVLMMLVFMPWKLLLAKPEHADNQ